MTPDTPADPQKGKPGEDEQAQLEAAEAKAKTRKPARRRKAATAQEGSAEPAAQESQGRRRPARKRVPTKRRPAATEATASAEAPDESKAEQPAESVPERPAAPAPAPRPARGAPAKAPRRRVVSAHARYVRTSARKARMVCGHLRGKSVREARAILAFTPREVARDWSKLLESAVANAESNHELLEDDLIVREAYADEGPTIKRFRPRAMGRATPIRKRTSHLTITLTPAPEPGNDNRRG
jgi:ribosomal protein L22